MLLLLAIKANRLRDGEDVRLVEGVIERGAAMAGSSKHDALCGHGWIRLPRVIRGHQPGHVDQQRRIGRLACKCSRFPYGLPFPYFFSTIDHSSMAQGMVPPSRCRLHIRRSCGRWKTFRKRPHSKLPCAPRRRVRHTSRAAADPPRDRT